MRWFSFFLHRTDNNIFYLDISSSGNYVTSDELICRVFVLYHLASTDSLRVYNSVRGRFYYIKIPFINVDFGFPFHRHVCTSNERVYDHR